MKQIIKDFPFRIAQLFFAEALRTFVGTKSLMRLKGNNMRIC